MFRALIFDFIAGKMRIHKLDAQLEMNASQTANITMLGPT